MEIYSRYPIFRIILLFGLLVYLLTAFFSLGFHHPDEHYQIIEFMNFKLGGISSTSLSWEYGEHIRPWLQPALYYALILPFKSLGLDNPFMHLFWLRLLMGLLGLVAIWNLVLAFISDFEELRERALLISLVTFTWFIPFVMVRTSSESLSISLMLIGISWFRERRSFSGFFMGLSFFVRFQMGIVVFFIFLYSLFVEKRKAKEIVFGFFAFVCALLLCVLVDRWGYGEWVFTPWEYFRANIIENKAAHFGVMPWWGYFKLITFKGIPPLSLVFELVVFIFWVKFPKHILTWCTLPFFLLHMGVGHKELRFLNYLYVLAPMMLVYIWKRYDFSKLWTRTWFKGLSYFLVGLNLILLLILTFKPAHTPVQVYKFLYGKTSPGELVNVLRNEREGHLTLDLNYYKKSGVHVRPVQHIPKGLLLTSTYTEYELIKGSKRCNSLFQSYPSWVLNYNYFNWLERSSIWVVWECGE